MQLSADDAYASLAAMVRHGIREAHVYEDGRYAFTARQNSDDGGAWLIQTLPALEGTDLAADETESEAA